MKLLDRIRLCFKILTMKDMEDFEKLDETSEFMKGYRIGKEDYSLYEEILLKYKKSKTSMFLK